MAAANKRQPPPGYPTRGNIVEASQVDNNIKDENETDRGISGRIMIGRPKSRSHERYPGPGLVHFDDYGPVQPTRGLYNSASGYDYPPPHGHGNNRYQLPVEFEVSDDEDEDDYENGYGHQQIPYNKRPQQFYRRETYVIDPPPPPPRRRPAYAPESNYYVRDEYVRY